MVRTPFTDMFDLDVPIALAPMAGVAGGVLAAAVTNAGGLGLVGGGYGDRTWVEREVSLAAREARGAWGVGFITWHLDAGCLELALRHRPAAVMLSFGDPAPYAPAIAAAGARLICQVTDLTEARAAAGAGAALIVAQGTEAGGHGGSRSTLTLVPAVADAVRPIPVLAAGGVADGRGLAAALALGAQGGLVGTRLYASRESLGHPRLKQRLVEAGGSETTRSGTEVFDAVRGYAWPPPYTGRALRNPFLRRWSGRADELRADPAERERFRRAVEGGDPDTAVVFAGEDLDLITSLESAGDLVRSIGAGAEEVLRELCGRVITPPLPSPVEEGGSRGRLRADRRPGTPSRPHPA
jgi:nitronate monooxygenase